MVPWGDGSESCIPSGVGSGLFSLARRRTGSMSSRRRRLSSQMRLTSSFSVRSSACALCSLSSRILIWRIMRAMSCCVACALGALASAAAEMSARVLASMKKS